MHHNPKDDVTLGEILTRMDAITVDMDALAAAAPVRFAKTLSVSAILVLLGIFWTTISTYFGMSHDVAGLLQHKQKAENSYVTRIEYEGKDYVTRIEYEGKVEYLQSEINHVGSGMVDMKEKVNQNHELLLKIYRELPRGST